MSNIANLGNFPHTIGNLDDRPNLPAAQMKAAFEQDVMELWGRLAEAIPMINDILPMSMLVKAVNSSSTDDGVPTAKAVYDAIVWATLGGNAQQIIDDWLDAHPEATTTVQDGSITNAKLAASFMAPTPKSVVANNTDLDTITETGLWFLNSGNTYTHTPYGSDYGGMLLVFRYNANTVFQMATKASSNEMYFRSSIGGTFNSWGSWYFTLNTVVPTNTDLDTVKDAGVWFLNSVNTYTHSPIPSGIGGMLLVFKFDSNNVFQIATNASTGEVFFRSSILGTFQSWASGYFAKRSVVPTNTDLDTVTEAGVWFLNSGNTYTHAPYSSDYGGTLLVFQFDASNIFQIATNAITGEVFFRSSVLGLFPGTWASGGGGPVTNNYTFNEYSSTNTINVNPSITTDTNAYLAPSGDSTDRTADIIAMLNSQGVCRLGYGDYYVSNLVMPTGTSIIGCGKKSKIILSGSSNGFAIKMSTNCTVSRVFIAGATSDIALSSTVGGRHGILWQGTYTADQSAPYESMVDNVYICSFSGGGITCYDTGYGTVNGLLVTNAYIWNCNAGINISYWSEFNKFTNVRTGYCYYGCINNGGNNVFTNCDFSSCKMGVLMDNSYNQSPNETHGSMVGCLFNHSDENSGIGIKILGCKNGYIFDGCQIFFSKIYIEDSNGIVVSNTNFGNLNCDITIKNGGSILFANNMHQTAPSVSTWQISISNNDKVHFSNCYVRDTGASVSN